MKIKILFFLAIFWILLNLLNNNATNSLTYYQLLVTSYFFSVDMLVDIDDDIFPIISNRFVI